MTTTIETKTKQMLEKLKQTRAKEAFFDAVGRKHAVMIVEGRHEPRFVGIEGVNDDYKTHLIIETVGEETFVSYIRDKKPYRDVPLNAQQVVLQFANLDANKRDGITLVSHGAFVVGINTLDFEYARFKMEDVLKSVSDSNEPSFGIPTPTLARIMVEQTII